MTSGRSLGDLESMPPILTWRTGPIRTLVARSDIASAQIVADSVLSVDPSAIDIERKLYGSTPIPDPTPRRRRSTSISP